MPERQQGNDAAAQAQCSSCPNAHARNARAVDGDAASAPRGGREVCRVLREGAPVDGRRRAARARIRRAPEHLADADAVGVDRARLVVFRGRDDGAAGRISAAIGIRSAAARRARSDGRVAVGRPARRRVPHAVNARQRLAAVERPVAGGSVGIDCRIDRGTGVGRRVRVGQATSFVRRRHWRPAHVGAASAAYDDGGGEEQDGSSNRASPHGCELFIPCASAM